MKNFFLIMMVCFMTGCAANVQQSVKTSNVQDGTMPDSIALDISASQSVSRSNDLSKSINELNQLISTDYKGSVMPKSSPNEADISVEITIEHFRYVSGFGRLMAGALIGNAELRLSVKLIDVATNEVVSESQLDTRSGFSEGLLGATTSRQLEAMSKKIVSIINSSVNNRQ
ncbi:hypothetical protein [Marinomonas mediterranea]|uniref:hypothetical protein n=1 Tax=Marinomonas mediterranea TaxID=119864 RepID=UPI00234B6281|nr:hypothetical protein [Marinomonas mediterranea]WCN09586.1 hypothetical protein GV055_11955 [Marinomonas mediterranea]